LTMVFKLPMTRVPLLVFAQLDHFSNKVIFKIVLKIFF
jgi:hypothetical protein